MAKIMKRRESISNTVDNIIQICGEIRMDMTLQTMTEEERAKLFPIILEKDNPQWKTEFEKEKAMILLLPCAGDITALHHYGSTSIPGIAAKPCVDILLEIKEETNLNKLIQSMETAGYIYINYNTKRFLIQSKNDIIKT